MGGCMGGCDGRAAAATGSRLLLATAPRRLHLCVSRMPGVGVCDLMALAGGVLGLQQAGRRRHWWDDG
jgi:hypothetical protein